MFSCVDRSSNNSVLAILYTVPFYNHLPSVLGEERELILVGSLFETNEFIASRLCDNFFNNVRVVYRSKGV
ncbi:hypothetical protein QX201_011305 [Fusarium graminearum]